MVGDPGIEPGVSRLEGVTVPCHTLRPVAHRGPDMSGRGVLDTQALCKRQPQNRMICIVRPDGYVLDPNAGFGNGSKR